MKTKILKAVNNYLKIAYENSQVPTKIIEMVKDIENSKSEDIFNLPIFERLDNNLFALRLGNIFYPHMKLVVKVDEDRLLFDIDTHDSVERIPPTLPGYDRFKKVIEYNKRVKEELLGILNKSQLTEDIEVINDLTVVFIDDESFILNIFKELATCLGVNVMTYLKAKDALKDIEKKAINPSICFVDVMMPEMSGYDFVNELKKKKIKNFPIVFTTGVNPARLNKTLADDYLLKPVSIKEIEAKLKKFKLI